MHDAIVAAERPHARRRYWADDDAPPFVPAVPVSHALDYYMQRLRSRPRHVETIARESRDALLMAAEIMGPGWLPDGYPLTRRSP